MKNPWIKSFVRREGRITLRQKQALENYWLSYGLSLEQGIIHFGEIFGSEAPVTLEIGFGMGDSLANQAKAEPFTGFIGVEIYRPGIGHLLDRLYEEQIHNVRIYQNDVVEVLNQCIPNNSLDRVQIFFPDPWPKRRHHKRRLIQAEFISLLKPKLKAGARLHLATDWENYAQQMMRMLSQQPFLENCFDHHQFMIGNVRQDKTKFEKRGERLGHHVWELMFIKKGF